MISKAQFLQGFLLMTLSAAMVSCSPAVPCNVIGGSGGAARLKRASSSNICGNGTGGGGTCSSTLKPVQVMFSVDSKGMILEYGIDSTSGSLTLMCNTATAAVGLLAVSNNAFLYVLDTSKTPAQVFGFAIAHGNSGVLTALAGSPFQLTEAIPGNAVIVPDPLNRFIFVTNHDGNDVHVLIIGTGGILSEATNSPFPVSSPDYIAINPAGTLAYVPDSLITDGDIFILSITTVGSSIGQLVPTSASPLIIPNPNDFAHFAVVHPNGKFLLTANTQSLSSFAIDPVPQNGGALTPVAGSPFSPALAGDSQVAPLTFALDMSGKFLYVVPEGTVGQIQGFLSDNIIAFAIDTTGGGLTTVPNSPFISSSTLDLVANPLLEQMFVVTSTTTIPVIFDVAPIDAGGNLTIPATGLTVTAEVHPVIANIN
jgi:6-phosphogluconolactonase (cycloisomerase 2 family)